MNVSDPPLESVYDNSFYAGQDAASAKAAEIYLPYLWEFVQPISVVDVGCGRGYWLQRCHQLGSNQLIGLDGAWNSQQTMVDSLIQFKATDLRVPFSLPTPVDLTISLEVAEHLSKDHAPQFISCLSKTADLIIFSAAFHRQGGTNHLNEQSHSYWAELFSRENFLPFDLFRPKFWSSEEIAFWYRQNTFLYARVNSRAYVALREKKLEPLKSFGFMDCVHPELYSRKFDVEPSASIRVASRHLVSTIVRKIRK